jgi:hypothetical protein
LRNEAGAGGFSTTFALTNNHAAARESVTLTAVHNTDSVAASFLVGTRLVQPPPPTPCKGHTCS